MLIAEQRSRNEFADLRPDRDMLDSLRQNRALLIQRARKLERMGLATEVETGRWTVSPRAESALRELGERGDIIKTMHRALTREGLADARLSLLKSRFGRGIGLPMETLADEF
jgi:type IV secretory pathway VirD2 relaxase